MRIRANGVDHDLVVQRDWCDWVVADSDGTIYSRHDSQAAARAALEAFAQRLLAAGRVAA